MYCIDFGRFPFWEPTTLAHQWHKMPIGSIVSGNSSKWTLCPLTNFVIIITAPTNAEFQYMNTTSHF